MQITHKYAREKTTNYPFDFIIKAWNFPLLLLFILFMMAGENSVRM